MDKVIYYFTGTGNSLAVARSIAGRTGAELVPLAARLNDAEVRTGARSIGLVFPVYYVDAPHAVRRFALKLAGIEGAYIWGLCTYGGGRGDALETLDAALGERGGKLAAKFGLHMPQNAFRKPWERHAAIYAAAERKCARVAAIVEERRAGDFLTNPAIALLLGGLRPKLRRLFREDLLAQTGLPEGASDEEIVHAMDRTFSANDSCNGCGVCARACPVGNVRLEGGRPRWGGRCENCLACYDFCPRRAIATGVAKREWRYRHPALSLADLEAQAGGRK